METLQCRSVATVVIFRQMLPETRAYLFHVTTDVDRSFIANVGCGVLWIGFIFVEGDGS